MTDDPTADVHARIATAEKALLEAKQELAELRRSAPPEPFEDYTFRALDGGEMRLSELFGVHRDLILVHYMGTSCPYCTLWADGYNGLLPHLENRAAFAVASKDPTEKLREIRDARGWRFRMLSAAENTFTREAGFEGEDGDPWPGVSTFRRQDDGSIVRVARAFFGPGDDFCSVWHFLDLLDGGAKGWQPKFSYT